jgi:hypothetical protein
VYIVLHHDVWLLPSVPTNTLMPLVQLLKVKLIEVSHDARRKQGIFLFPKTDMSTMELTQPLIRWVPVYFLVLKRPEREGDRSPPYSTEVRITGGTILLLYAFQTCTMTTLLLHTLKFYFLFDKLKRYIPKVLIKFRQN